MTEARYASLQRSLLAWRARRVLAVRGSYTYLRARQNEAAIASKLLSARHPS